MNRPPRIPLAIFRLFSNKEWREDVEGDLLEQFNKRIKTEGISRARFLFVKDITQLLFSGWMIYQLHQRILNMKHINWIKLVGFNLLLVILIISQFLPGPPSKLVIGVSIAGQVAGLAGLLLVPVALIWIIYEAKKLKAKKPLGWKLPFWMAISSLVIATLIFAVFILGTYLNDGWLTATGVFVFFILGLSLAIRGISRLKRNNKQRFNPAPLYLFTIPVIAFLTNLYMVKPASEYGRALAIERAQELITAIENYKLREGKYPESISELYVGKVPSPKVMGILKFRYNKINEDYSLSFSQWLDWGSLEVIVLYDKNNLRNNLKGSYAEWDYSFDICRTNAAFASYDTKFENWRYYLCD